jgi:Tfp pilus assembly protein PilF
MSRLDHILTDKHGGQVVEFIIDHLPPEQIGSASRVLLKPLREKSPNLADRLFKRMVEASPNDGNTLGNYALFLEHEMQNYDLADAYFKRAIEATATPAWTFRAYGAFLESRRDDTDMADVFYKLAIESDPHDANHYGHYAIFLARRGEMAGAGEHFKRAIALDPKNATNLGNYALFLGRRGDKADAKEYYKRAIDADPKRPSILTNYAVELEDSEDLGAAEAYYKRAINVDPKHAYSLANYGEFLLDFGRLDDGEKTLLSALENLEPAEKETTGEVCFSLWLVSRMKGEDALNWERAFKFVIQNGFEREPWDFDRMLAQAQRTLQPAEFEYAKALAAAFLDASKVPQLEQYDRWRALEPLDPTSLAKAATS